MADLAAQATLSHCERSEAISMNRPCEGVPAYRQEATKAISYSACDCFDLASFGLAMTKRLYSLSCYIYKQTAGRGVSSLNYYRVFAGFEPESEENERNIRDDECDKSV